MTEKELRKLNRYQLLELLIMQTERADELQKKLDEIENSRQEQNIRINNLGSVAEAALQISGVLESAQQAADLYLEGAKKEADVYVENAKKEADKIIQEARDKSVSILESVYKNAFVRGLTENTDEVM